jgi:hypothetical protein
MLKMLDLGFTNISKVLHPSSGPKKSNQVSIKNQAASTAP